MAVSKKTSLSNGRNTDSYGELGLRLRQEREAEGLSIAEVAEAVGVTKPHVSMIEKGVNKPGPKLLAKLEDLFGITPGELFALIGQDRPKERLAVRKDAESQKDATDEHYGGIVGHKEGLITGTLANAIHGTKTTIDVLDSWIGEDLDRLNGPFREAVGRGVQIRLILLHPDIAPERVRYMEFPTTYTNFAGFIAHANIDTFITWYQEWRDSWEHLRHERNERRKLDPEWAPWGNWQPDCLQIRLLPFLPPLQYHRYDDNAFVGFYLHIEHSRQGPQLDLVLRHKESGYLMRTTFGRSFADEFAYLWDLLEKVPSAHVDLTQSLDHAERNGDQANGSVLPSLQNILAEITAVTQRKRVR